MMIQKKVRTLPYEDGTGMVIPTFILWTVIDFGAREGDHHVGIAGICFRSRPIEVINRFTTGVGDSRL
jgi:hypothetical protein